MRTILASGMLLLLSGCAARDSPAFSDRQLPQGQAALLAELPVFRVQRENCQGTATYLGQGRYVTAKHVVPPHTREIMLDDQTCMIAPVNWGPGTGPEDDWLVFIGDGQDWGSSIVFDYTAEVPSGTPIYLVGYWDPGIGEGLQPSVYAVAGRIKEQPYALFSRISPFFAAPPNTLCVEAGLDLTFTGISGGPAVVWSDREKRYLMIGIYRGTRRWQIGPLTWSRHQVVRPTVQ